MYGSLYEVFLIVLCVGYLPVVGKRTQRFGVLDSRGERACGRGGDARADWGGVGWGGEDVLPGQETFFAVATGRS